MENQINDQSKQQWKLFIEGNNDAYAWLYSHYVQHLYQFGCRFTDDSELVKDCIQDVFIQIYQNHKNLSLPENVKVYFMAALKNCLFNSFARKQRFDTYMQRSTIPTQTGFITSPWANYGKVTNKGVDASLNYNTKINKDWSAGLRSTFSYAINKVTEKDEPIERIGTYRGLTGRSMNTLWGLQAERLFTKDDFDANGNLKFGIPTQEVGASTIRPGDIKYKDMDGDGKITDADEGYIGGTNDPRIVYGFGGNLVFRQWDLNIFFQGIADTHRIIGGSSYFIPGSGQGLLGNIYDNYQDRWTEENPSQDVFWPRLSESPNKQNYRSSTWWKKDMSFLRCKTIELGYTLPKNIIDKFHEDNDGSVKID